MIIIKAITANLIINMADNVTFCTWQNVRKQVAPLLKNFQGEVFHVDFRNIVE